MPGVVAVPCDRAFDESGALLPASAGITLLPGDEAPAALPENGEVLPGENTAVDDQNPVMSYLLGK